MSTEPPLAIVVDCDEKGANLPGATHELWDDTHTKIFLISVKSEAECTRLFESLISLKGSDFQQCADVIHSDNLVEIFYKLKCKMDDDDITKIRIFTGEVNSTKWERLCSIFLTPVYDFEVSGTRSNNHDHDTLMLDQLAKEAAYFVTSIPSRGITTVFKSAVIPDDIFIHGYHNRHGGISRTKAISSMNMLYTQKKKDSMVVIQENRRRVAEQIGFDLSRLVTVKVEHGGNVWRVGDPITPSNFDGLISNEPEVTLGALGADCIVLLFADPIKKACGACHAGWKGTLDCVAPNTIDAMVKSYNCDPKDIRVVMGPSIKKCCFRVKVDEAVGFSDIDPACTGPITGDMVPVDLQKTNRILLEKRGVLPEHIDDVTLTTCTCCTGDFFSHQRDGIPFGNQMGFIALRGDYLG